MTDITFGGLYRGPLTQLAEFEKTNSTQRVIPLGTPMLIYEKQSWWRRLFSSKPRVKNWPHVQPTSVEFFAFELGSPVEKAYVRWLQPTVRYGG